MVLRPGVISALLEDEGELFSGAGEEDFIAWGIEIALGQKLVGKGLGGIYGVACGLVFHRGEVVVEGLVDEMDVVFEMVDSFFGGTAFELFFLAGNGG